MIKLISCVAVATALGALAGCSKKADAKSEGTTTAAESKGGDPASTTVDLAPLPLQAKVPPGGAGVMDMSRDGKKSVKLDVGGGVTINVSETSDDLAAVKKRFEDDKILFPFKKWAKEGGDHAIVEFEIDGKTGFLGFRLLKLGALSYVCQTTGLAGAPSAEQAAKQLEACASISAK